MNLETRDKLKKHLRLVNALRKGGPQAPQTLLKELGISGSTLYTWLDEGKNLGIYTINSNKQIELSIDKSIFKIITVNGNTYRDIRKKIRENLATIDSNENILLLVFVIDGKAINGKKVLLDNYAYNIFDGIELTQSDKELVVVDKDTLKVIHVKNKYSRSNISCNNIVYFNLLDGRFRLIEDNCLKTKNYDDHYGEIPMFPHEKQLIYKLHTLYGSEYKAFYEENKDKIYQIIIPKIFSISVFLRPDIIATDMEVLKPNIDSDILNGDMEYFIWKYFPEDANVFNQNVVFEHFTSEDLKKASELYAENTFFRWIISWF